MADTAPVGLHRIVVVGGGAGGLELVTRLGDRLGKRRKALVTLVDQSRTHLWKPLLHQVAAGSMDLNDHELDYLFQARWHHFQFRLGRMQGLDRARKEIRLAPIHDDRGREVIAASSIAYDTLVLALGSTTNDFGTPGAAEHAISLDTPQQAALFHSRLLNACLRANAQDGPLQPGQLHIAIIGAGATGVELAAELHNTTREFVAFGLGRIDPERDIKLTIVEAAPRILPALLGTFVQLRARAAAQAQGRGADGRASDGSVRARHQDRDRPRAAGGARGLGGRDQGAGSPQGHRWAGDQPDQSAGRDARVADHTRPRHLRPG